MSKLLELRTLAKGLQDAPDRVAYLKAQGLNASAALRVAGSYSRLKNSDQDHDHDDRGNDF